MDSVVFQTITFLQHLSSESLSLITFCVCSTTILGLFRIFGFTGLAVYNTTAIVIANIQVLHTGVFSFSPDPVALGTVVFSSTFLVSDILTEHYGEKAAQKALWLSFISQLFVTILMIMTLGHPPLESDKYDTARDSLFCPSPRIFIASLFAYALSQLLDIWLFQKIRILSHGRFLWLRQNAATFFSSLSDSFLFSFIAWVILNPNPIPIRKLLVTYVLGTFFVRIIINIMGTPLIYLSYSLKPKNLP